MTLCKRHHVVLCDQLPDAVLDALSIPASDSGDFCHVASQFQLDSEDADEQSDCEVCQRKEEEVYRVNTAPGLWHVDMPNFDEYDVRLVRFFNRATSEIPAPLVCGDLDWWYTDEQAAINAQQVFLRYDLMTEVTNELLRLKEF